MPSVYTGAQLSAVVLMRKAFAGSLVVGDHCGFAPVAHEAIFRF